jgi:hypothetical protein
MEQIRWRRWNRVIHRDLGYLCVGLTVIYAVSGVAVNHLRDWNPNYSVTETPGNVGPVTAEDPRSPEVVRGILSALGLDNEYGGIFRRNQATLVIFLDGGRVSVNLPTGNAVVRVVRDRKGLQEANFLHLNRARRLWTYAADLYAICLLLVAITGLFIIQGAKGITGRGAWLTGAGVLIPLFFLWLYL